MKRNRLLSLLTLSFVSLFILQSNSGGYQGAIVADNSNGGCSGSGSGCHAVATAQNNNGLTIDILDANNNPVNFYDANTTYKIKISLKKNNITSNLTAGFQCTIFDVQTSNSQGSFPGISGNTHVRQASIGGKTVITHKQGDVTGIVSGSTVEWVFDWKSSLLGNGNLIFSVIANDANGDQAATNADIITYNSKFISQTAPNNVHEFSKGINNLYPNPSTGMINIELASEKESIVSVLSYTGQKLKTISAAGNNIQLDITDLTPGNYIISVQQGDNFARKQIVKN